MPKLNEQGKTRKLLIAVPRGFCAGVARAVQTAENVCRNHQVGSADKVYCLHQIVHNDQVVESLRQRGMVFVDSLEAVPPGSLLVLSAHGVSPQVRTMAAKKQLQIIDATCPYVHKVHNEVKRFAESGLTVILIGDRRHQEVLGVVGEAPASVKVIATAYEAEALTVPDPEKVAVVSQTTLSLDQTTTVLETLRRRFPRLQETARGNICYATENRQRAVAELARCCGLVLVLGSPQSSNSCKLVDVARSAGCRAELVNSLKSLQDCQFQDIGILGLTSGASTPDTVFTASIEFLKQQGFTDIEELCVVREKSDPFK